MPTTNFAPDFQQELTSALQDFVNTHGAAHARERLNAAMDAVGANAARTGMTPEAMVIALRHIYERIDVRNRPDAHVRSTYDRLLSGCLQAYSSNEAGSAPDCVLPGREDYRLARSIESMPGRSRSREVFQEEVP